MSIEDTKKYPFTRYPNYLLEKILISDFTKNEQKVLGLIIRLSIGCLNRSFCQIKKCNFKTIGISASKITDILYKLVEKNVISIDPKVNELKITINHKTTTWIVKKNGYVDELKELIGKNLSKRKIHTSQNENKALPKTESQKPNNAPELANKQTPKEIDKEKLKKNTCVDNKIIKKLKNTNSKINYGIEPIRDILNRQYIQSKHDKRTAI